MEKNSGSGTMIPLLHPYPTILLADGAFPTHAIPTTFLKTAHRIVCCDGAAASLLAAGREPDYIVGDLDSLSTALKRRFAPILHASAEQETNDLTKAVHFCVRHGWTSLTVLGATGKREDHTLGNLSLLLEYAKIVSIQLLTDYGVFVPQCQSAAYESRPGQQVSLFCLTPATRLSVSGLRYPIHDRSLTAWWQGTLNEACADSFDVEMDAGELLVFREY
jgi:thiamine pyrophosphokinase